MRPDYMLGNLDELLSVAEPNLLILDETYGSERSVRERIEEDLKQFAFSTWDSREDSHKEEMAIALQSLVFLTAQDISRRASEFKDTVHLRKEHIEKAIEDATNALLRHPIESVRVLDNWKSAAKRFLESELRGEGSKREAIFRTCERLKIDTADFAKIFRELPS
jgi:hypothetical protein